MWHGFRESKDLDGYICCFRESILRGELAWTVSDPALHRLLWDRSAITQKVASPIHFNWKGKRLSQLVKELEAICALGDVDDVLDRASRIGRLILILTLLCEDLKQTEGGGSSTAELHPSIRRALELIEEEPAATWETRSLCSRLRINPDYFTRLFKRATGLTPMDYVGRRRLEKAATLLLGSDSEISEIGATLGWDDSSHFARRFKAHFGVSAREYRNRFKKS